MDGTTKLDRLTALLGALFGAALSVWYFYQTAQLELDGFWAITISLILFGCFCTAVASALLKVWAVIVAICVASLFAIILLFSKPSSNAVFHVGLKCLAIGPLLYIAVMTYWLFKLNKFSGNSNNVA